MTEHVHEWEWIYRTDGRGPRYVVCCHCAEPISHDEQMRRINATEMLSAEQAKDAWALLLTKEEAQSNMPLTDKAEALKNSLKAYADTLVHWMAEL